MKRKSREDEHKVKVFNAVSLCCNLSALIYYVAVFAGGIISLFYAYGVVRLLFGLQILTG